MPKTRAKTTKMDPAEAAKKIWLAGIGALAIAEEEGSKLFENLVAKGKKNPEMADFPKKAVKTARTKVESMWEKVGHGLEDRVQNALHRIGVPTRDEITGLSRRVDALNRALDGKKKTTRRRSPRAKAAAATQA